MADTITPDQVLEAVASWTLMEVKEFVDKFEEKFDVTAAAAAPVMMAGAVAGGDAAPAAEEKDEFTVVLKGIDASKKIGVIKAVRAVKPELGLKEAKEVVEGAPKDLAEDVPKEEAEKMKKTLEEAGAEVELK